LSRARFQLSQEPQASEIILGPTRLQLQHGMKNLGSKGLTWPVVGNGDTPPVPMAIVLVRPCLSVEHKTITNQSANDCLGSEASQRRIVDRHGSDSNGDQGFFGYLYCPRWRPLDDRLAVLDHAGHDHFHDLL
jgi:hypothetical protein